jgi:23S rRNA pseudouridine1911/1915/1917 synthase
VPPPPSKEIQGEDIPIEVLFEDEHMLVLNKSPDIIVHPARSHNKGTLLNALVYYFQKQSSVGGGLSSVGDEFARPGVVHRLDRRTSGVMVIAKSDEAHWKLGRQFERREPDKRYLALVEGVIESDVDVIDAPIGPSISRARGQREKMSIRRDHLGKPAVTIYRVRQRFERYTLVELELKTGRTHQIRVHMTHLGYPLVGDDMYAGHIMRASHVDPRGGDDDVVLGRQALHAALLTLRHPIEGRSMTFTAPVREDMSRAVAMLRAYARPSELLTPSGSVLDLDVALSHVPPGT